MNDLNLEGATVIQVKPGDMLRFVVKAHMSLEDFQGANEQLKKLFPGIDVGVIGAVDSVIHKEGGSDEETVDQE